MADEVNNQEAIIEQLMIDAEECIKEDDFVGALDKCDDALVLKRDNPKAYLLSLMAQYECKTLEDLKELSENYIYSYNYKNLFKYGDVEWYALKSQLRIYAEESLLKYYERLYNEAKEGLEKAKTVKEVKAQIKIFKKIKKYEDAVLYVDACNEKINAITRKNKKHNKNVKQFKRIAKCSAVGLVLGTVVSVIIIVL